MKKKNYAHQYYLVNFNEINDVIYMIKWNKLNSVEIQKRPHLAQTYVEQASKQCD